MKISLIELTVFDTSAIGVRSLSASLKKAGFQVQLIFLANYGEKNAANIFLYTEQVIEQTVDLCKNSDLIGISFLTSGFHRAVQLTERFKAVTDTPVIWGGIHATIEPEQCLNYADMVCRGEGEEPLVELVQSMAAGKDYLDTRNFWFKRGEEIIKNPVRPLTQDLDALPALDYDLAGDSVAYVEKKGGFYHLDRSLLLEFIEPKGRRVGMQKKPFYSTMASRGCPNTCAYCIHSIYKPMYPRQRYIRRRSAANIIQELEHFINMYDFDGIIWFADDDFTAASTNVIKEFSELFKEKIGMPFFCFGSPNSISEKKLKYLTDAGLQSFQYGIQTGSTKTRKMFNRSFSSQTIIDGCNIIHKFNNKIPLPYYDFILDNPWEIVDDEIETLDLILQLPKPYELALASFRYFPGSILYEKAKKQGLVNLEMNQIYSGEFHQLKNSYISCLIALYAYFHFPKFIIKYLSHPKVVRFVNRPLLSPFFMIPYKLSRLIRKFLY